MSAKYWVVQHISDLMRAEPRNVGVIAQVGEELVARFLGESVPREIDGRKLRHMPHPDVYRQWVEYWRDCIDRGDLAACVDESRGHYRVRERGTVSDIGRDSPQEVIGFLYALLVSEGGFEEAVASEGGEQEAESVGLERAVCDAFEDRELFSEKPLLIRHPVRRHFRVQGRSQNTYTPSFAQENGELCIMEPVDFTMARKRFARDHAGWSAYMFRDVRDARSSTQAIAIVRVTPQDLTDDDVENGLGMLRDAGDVVNWLDTDERRAFIAERERMAEAL